MNIVIRLTQHLRVQGERLTFSIHIPVALDFFELDDDDDSESQNLMAQQTQQEWKVRITPKSLVFYTSTVVRGYSCLNHLL